MKIEEQINKYEQRSHRILPILIEQGLIREDLDYFDDYLLGGEEHA